MADTKSVLNELKQSLTVYKQSALENAKSRALEYALNLDESNKEMVSKKWEAYGQSQAAYAFQIAVGIVEAAANTLKEEAVGFEWHRMKPNAFADAGIVLGELVLLIYKEVEGRKNAVVARYEKDVETDIKLLKTLEVGDVVNTNDVEWFARMPIALPYAETEDNDGRQDTD